MHPNWFKLSWSDSSRSPALLTCLVEIDGRQDKAWDPTAYYFGGSVSQKSARAHGMLPQGEEAAAEVEWRASAARAPLQNPRLRLQKTKL